MPSFLTRRQKEILDFIVTFREEQGISPTHREIRERFGYSSYGTVHKHLRLLREKGYLKRSWNQKRGLEIVRQASDEERELPFLGMIAAGQPIEAVTDEARLSVPSHLTGDRAAQYFVLRVKGDSMIEEGIHEGDLIVVRKQKRARPGELVVALLGDEATLKRFFPEGETARLEPANRSMESIRVPAADLRIQGVVSGLMRRF